MSCLQSTAAAKSASSSKVPLQDISGSSLPFVLFQECSALTRYLSLPAVHRRLQVHHLPGMCCGQQGNLQWSWSQPGSFCNSITSFTSDLLAVSAACCTACCKSLVPAACRHLPGQPSLPPVNPPPLFRCKALLKAGCKSEISSEDTRWSLKLLDFFPVLPAVHCRLQVHHLPGIRCGQLSCHLFLNWCFLRFPFKTFDSLS